MGLGPPVCEKCMVFYDSYGWECPVCKTNDKKHITHLWTMPGFNMDKNKDKITPQLEANKRFYDFMMGKEKE